MGMMIEESMKVLQEVPKVMPITEASINVALDTMCKYQKIKQILKDIPYGGEATVRRIQEVVEDGTN